MEKKSYETYTFYVGNNGKDTNPGTIEEPFATLERAREAVRQLKRQVNGLFTVFVREGTYYFESTLTFGPEDSGKEGAVITYQAYPGEMVILSGGRRVVGEWKPYRDGIVVCELSDWAETGIGFTQLFVDGKRQTRARYPKVDTAGTKARGMLNPAASKLVWPHTQFKFDPASFTKKRWSNPQKAIVHMFPKNYWGNLQWEVADIDWDANTVYLGRGGYQINDIMQGEDATGIDERSLYYIENVFEELDSPGEWYWNGEEGKLYWMPQEDVDIQKAVVEVSGLKTLLQFKGSQETPVHHIRLSGFQIAHTETTFLETYEAPSLGDWTIHRGGAIYFEGSEQCVVEHCFFNAVGGNAIFLSNYNLGNILHGNKITEAGESGICLVGSKHLTLGSNHAYSSQIKICNNVIQDIGQFGKQTAGVFISVSKENTVSHNHISHVPRAAICINDGTWGGHVIEFNDIHDTVRETGDHGPFNSWGRDRYWCLNQSHGPSSHCAGDVKRDARQTVIIRNNRFRDHKGWGIDLDDGSSNYHIYNNLCIGVSIKLREGDYRTVENNIFVNGANPPGIHIGYEDNHDRFVHNIIVANSQFDNPETDIDFQKGDSKGKLYECIGPPLRGRWVEKMDSNLFYNDLGHFLATVHFRPLGSSSQTFTLEEWQTLGLDLNSVYGDPLFVDPEQGDYRVRDESPALKLGFRNFEMNRFGLLPDFKL